MQPLTHKFDEYSYSRESRLAVDPRSNSPPEDDIFRPRKIPRQDVSEDLVSCETRTANDICRLPLELLGEIFQFYVAEEPTPSISQTALRRPSLTSTLSSSASPFPLCGVCWIWRDFALTTPSLWSSLAVYRPRSSQIPTIRLWLERSRDHPLFLYLNVHCSGTLDSTLNNILSLFIARAHRWRHLYLKLRVDTPSLIRNLPFHLLRKLDSVEFDIEHENEWYEQRKREPEDGLAPPIWKNFYSVPSLRRISWPFFYFPCCLPPFAPWAQLTHIKLPEFGGLTVDGMLKALLYCENLIDLELTMKMPTITIPAPRPKFVYSSDVALESLRRPQRAHEPQKEVSDSVVLGRLMTKDSDMKMALFGPIDLPKLRYLKIHAHQRDAAPLLDRLMLPALESLHIQENITSWVPGPPSTGYITELLERSAIDNLQTLSINDPDLAEDEVLKLLASPRLRDLRRLELLVSSATDSTIEVLTHTSGPQRFPNLKCLVLPQCVTSDGVLATMVVSRRPILGTMKFSVAKDAPLIHDVSRLRELADQSDFCLSVM